MYVHCCKESCRVLFLLIYFFLHSFVNIFTVLFIMIKLDKCIPDYISKCINIK